MAATYEYIVEIVTESWYNAIDGGYKDQLYAMTLEERVDDMMDFDAHVAEFPREIVKQILARLMD